MINKKRLGMICVGMLLLVTGCTKADFVQPNPEAETQLIIEEESSNVVFNNNVSYTFEDLRKPNWNDQKLEDKVKTKLASMTLEEKIAQMFIVDPDELTGVDDVTKAGQTTIDKIKQYPVGGIIYLDKNLDNYGQVSSMIGITQDTFKERIGMKAFLCVQEESGSMAMIGKSENKFRGKYVDGQSEIGVSEDMNKAYVAGYEVGKYLKNIGFNVNLAPVADPLTNSENTAYTYRSFGTNPDMVSFMTNAYLAGMHHNNNIIGVVKHFPGEAAVAESLADGAASTDKTLNQLMIADMKPFKEAADYGAPIMMVSHMGCSSITGDETPSSLSEKMVTDVLRKQLGYEGIVMTDSMKMAAITDNYSVEEATIMAIKAGVDMIFEPSDFEKAYQSVLHAVNLGEVNKERIDDAVYRILKVKFSYLS